MIFSKKKIIHAYTVEKCNKCGNTTKRKFAKNDVLFYETSKCSSCDGMMSIDKIFGESVEQ